MTSTVDLDPGGGETNRSSNQAFQPHRFTSYERDANGGDDAMFRRYQVSSTRFAQPDPYDGSYDLTDPQSFNRYAYVQNDPMNFVDPSGLDGLPGDLCPGGVIGNDGKCYEGPIETVEVREPSWRDLPITHEWGGFLPLAVVSPQEPRPTPPAQPLPPNYRPRKDIEQPCIDRAGDVERDIRSIARMLNGKVTNVQTGQRFGGGRISLRGQSFGKVVDTFYTNGYSENYSLGHPEGWGFHKQFSDGLWYHVILNFPKGTESGSQPNARASAPQVTAHCHATNPHGMSHLIDSIF